MGQQYILVALLGSEGSNSFNTSTFCKQGFADIDIGESFDFIEGILRGLMGRSAWYLLPSFG